MRWRSVGLWTATLALTATAEVGAGLFPSLCYWQGRLKTTNGGLTPMAWSPDAAGSHIAMSAWAAGWITLWILNLMWVGRLRCNVAFALVPLGTMLGLGWQELRLAYACNIF